MEGRIGIWFHFYKGRLYEVTAGPFFASDRPSNMTDSERTEWWRECDEWGGRVRAILREKYGAPFDGPTEAVLASAKKNGGMPELRWAWQIDDFGIEYIRRNEPLQWVRYLDVGKFGREAWESDRAYREAKEKERKNPF